MTPTDPSPIHQTMAAWLEHLAGGESGPLEDDLRSIWGRITCPTLLIRGTESWASDPEEDGRITAFQDARLASFDGAGHWVHHDRLDDFVREIRDFLAE